MSSRVLTPANQITILRMVFVPVFAILVIEGSYRAALAVLVAAALSDVLDGVIARRLKEESPLGVALDPIADKILLATAFLTLAFLKILPWWLTILVLSRDVAIIFTTALISIVAGYRPFHPSRLGKASTVAQVTTVFVALGHMAQVPLVTAGLVEVCVFTAATLTVVSGLFYLLKARHGHGHPDPEDPAASNASHTTAHLEDLEPPSKVGSRSER